MTALTMESGNYLTRRQSARSERPPCPDEPTALQGKRRYFPTWLLSRRYVGAIIAMGGAQLMAMMDGPVAVFALPRIQNELGLSNAGRSGVITASC